jgi:hypothetical protein
MISTIPIIYNAGAYGTYVEWCLTTLCSTEAIQEPFNANGNSHGFQGNFLSRMPGWRDYVSASTQHKFVRLHPKTSAEESLTNNLTEILEPVPGIIYLYPDRDSMMLGVNNYLSKPWHDWWLHHFSTSIDVSKIYSNWAVNNTPITEIPMWIRREFLSFYLMPAWYDQVEWYHLDTWTHPRSHNVLIKDLLYNFESVMTGLQQALDLDFVRPIADLLPYHEKNLQLQTHKNQDQLCKHIVDSIVNNVEFDWSDQNLPLASESYIQWQLRNLGYEIQCHELDKFPTNSVHLQELLYTI